MGFFDRFKNKKEKTQNEEDIFSDFLKNYPPEENLIKPSEHIIDAARSVKVPEEIINFWTSYGFGNYGDGIIKMIDPEKYIKLKRELKEDIAIGMNIPFDLLSSENSNRATSQSAMEALYSNIIIPLQDRFLIQLRKQLLSWYRSEKGSTCWE